MAALVEGLIDNFNDNSFNTALWKRNSADRVVETNQEIEISTTTSSSDYYFNSNDDWDLVGSYATIKIIDIGNIALSSYIVFLLYFYKSGLNIYFSINEEAGKILAWYNGKKGASVNYDADTFRYLKIRESGGTIYWDYSSNGIDWNNFTSTSDTVGATDCTVYVEVIADAEASATTAKVDDFNILPEASTYSGQLMMIT